MEGCSHPRGSRWPTCHPVWHASSARSGVDICQLGRVRELLEKSEVAVDWSVGLTRGPPEDVKPWGELAVVFITGPFLGSRMRQGAVLVSEALTLLSAGSQRLVELSRRLRLAISLRMGWARRSGWDQLGWARLCWAQSGWVRLSWARSGSGQSCSLCRLTDLLYHAAQRGWWRCFGLWLWADLRWSAQLGPWRSWRSLTLDL